MTDNERKCEFVPLSENELLDWTSRIGSGERSDEIDVLARRVLQDFCTRQWLGAPHSEITLGWLADVLSKVMEHQDARELLGLRTRASNRPVSDDLRFEVASWVYLARSRGYKSGEANELAAACFHRDIKSIERDVREAKLHDVNMSADWDEHFLSIRRPLPPPKD